MRNYAEHIRPHDILSSQRIRFKLPDNYLCLFWAEFLVSGESQGGYCCEVPRVTPQARVSSCALWSHPCFRTFGTLLWDLGTPLVAFLLNALSTDCLLVWMSPAWTACRVDVHSSTAPSFLFRSHRFLLITIGKSSVHFEKITNIGKF